MEALIRTTDVTRRFGRFCAVQSLNLELHPGEIVGLLGPNGAGKSTTLRILSGCLAPSQGSVLVGGIDLQRDPKSAKRSIGYLPDPPPLYQELRVDEYLAFCAQLRGVGGSRLREKKAQVKQQCGLSDCGHRMIGNLSRGYQQRVGIAQALIHDPQVIILDEPSSGLDPNQIVEIRMLIKSLGSNHSIILSSHILAEVESVCDRVLIMNNGRLMLSERLQQFRAPRQTRLRVRFGAPPGLEEINSLQGVANAESLGDGSFELLLQDDHATETLAETLIAQRWGLCELTPFQPSLEQLFTRLTTADRGAHNA